VVKLDKYIKCFSDEDITKLQQLGFVYLFSRNGVHWFENNEKLNANFSESPALKDVKFTNTVNF